MAKGLTVRSLQAFRHKKTIESGQGLLLSIFCKKDDKLRHFSSAFEIRGDLFTDVNWSCLH